MSHVNIVFGGAAWTREKQNPKERCSDCVRPAETGLIIGKILAANTKPVKHNVSKTQAIIIIYNTINYLFSLFLLSLSLSPSFFFSLLRVCEVEILRVGKISKPIGRNFPMISPSGRGGREY